MAPNDCSDNGEDGKQEEVEHLSRCTCGIEIARANERYPERDCPYVKGRS